MNTAMTFVTALCDEHVPVRDALSYQLVRALGLCQVAPEKSSSRWCRAMFYVLMDMLQSTLSYGQSGVARNAIVEEVRYVEWYEPTESYDYQVELKWHHEAVHNIANAMGGSGSTNAVISQLPSRAALLAYRIYATEQGFINDEHSVAT